MPGNSFCQFGWGKTEDGKYAFMLGGSSSSLNGSNPIFDSIYFLELSKV